MRADAPDERWDGFWCELDGLYYARCTESGGVERWFRIADETVSRTYSVRWSRLGSRSILVGTSRRRSGRSVR